MGIDWTQITDFQLFMMLAPTMPKETTSIIFGDGANAYISEPEEDKLLIYVKILNFIN